MKSSKSIRIRKYLISPETPRSMKFCFDPKQVHKSLLVSPINHTLRTDPFENLESKDKPKLKPVMLKNSKKCITSQSGSSISMNLPSKHKIEFKKKPNLSFLPSLQSEILTPRKTLKHCISQANNLRFIEFNDKSQEHFKKAEGRKHLKKVSFAEKNLEISFGKEEPCESIRGKY